MNHMSGTIVAYIKPHLLTNIVLYDYNQPTFTERFSHNSVVYLSSQQLSAQCAKHMFKPITNNEKKKEKKERKRNS